MSKIPIILTSWSTKVILIVFAATVEKEGILPNLDFDTIFFATNAVFIIMMLTIRKFCDSIYFYTQQRRRDATS